MIKKSDDKHFSFIIIVIGIVLSIISYYIGYQFLIGEYHVTSELGSIAEPAFRLGFLALLIWLSALVIKRGIELYAKT